MNVTLNPLAPLPRALNLPRQDGWGRRHRIGDHEIDRDVLRRFNELLARLDLQQPALDRDQVSSAARELVDDTDQGDAPRCIQQRMRRAAAIDLMVYDPDWESSDEVVIHATVMVVAYLRGSLSLIPNALPVVGRLDDAIVVEAAWPSLATEVRQYLGFCRLRQVEASLCGETRRHFGFTRKQWQAAARAEADWIAHCERIGQDSYLMDDATPRFRVD